MLASVAPPVFENAAGRLFEHADGYVVFQYHPGKRALPDLQALLIHTGLLLRRHKWHKLLGDQRLMTPFTAEERQWIVDYWLDPSHFQPGGIFAAVLLANDVFARLAANQVLHDIKTAALTYRHFDSEAAAAGWLRQLA